MTFASEDDPGRVLQTHTLQKCTACGFVSLHPVPTQEELDAFYRPSYYTQNWQTDYAQNVLYRPNSEKIKRLFKKNPLQLLVKLHRFTCTDRTRFFKDQSTLLDIGCGNGVYLLNVSRAAQARGIRMKLYGLDINPPVHQELLGHDITIKQGSFESEIYPNAYFDFVVSHHAIEHLRDPEKIFQKIFSILKVGGKAALEVPNASSLSFKLFGKKWSGISYIGHLYYFSPRTFRDLAENAGFRVLKIRYTEDAETFLFSLLRLLRVPEEATEKLARSAFLNVLFIPVVVVLNFFKVGDNIEIILQK